MKVLIQSSILLIATFFAGCTGGTTTSNTQEFHFQGRDCLACHNVDLQKERNLFIGGTLFKDKSLADANDLSTVCGGELVLKFLDSSYNVVYSSKDYIDPNSKGSNGKGNLFILDRKVSAIEGDFYMQITDKNANVLAISSTLHSFNGKAFDINNSIDYNNRHSCNSCHTQGSVSPLYTQSNSNICK